MKEKKHPVCSECPVHHLCGTNWRDEFGRIDCKARVEKFKKKGGLNG
ncbi:hypothetical protein [Fibrobacter succinogenes]|nr:hypothetical protein [Fibrobacter succinogenes]